ncbi:possible permeases of the major facilitator superfamily [Aurantimonas manganoxydans SI85-9A1]|uniref:Possible permeases of the major facilitator superfamily n=3 Tax=Aurantimonas manganoxydans TaxID=651183 RepID=Q1YHQ0_AURMS|nr:possible permeases of the major facilitator superfamily [Aurantimonas manganoxydans SI85-9A1]
MALAMERADMDSRERRSGKRARSPRIDRLFVYGAMLPLLTGALILWFAPEAQSFLALNLTLFWGASVLMFVAGVRRGASLRQPGGAAIAEIVVMIGLFLAGVASLVATIWAFPLAAALLQIAGFASLGILDRIAAPNDDGQPSVERLRPLQICAPIAVIAAVAIWIWRSPFL